MQTITASCVLRRKLLRPAVEHSRAEFIASIGEKPRSVTTREAARKQLAGRFQAEHARSGYETYLVSLEPETPGKQQASFPTGATPVGTVASVESCLMKEACGQGD